MTTAYTQGMAGNDPVYRRTIPTLKHFCANNNEKDRTALLLERHPTHPARILLPCV